MTKKIFVVGGGTGGHLFPAISLAEEIKSRGQKVLLITDSRCIKYLNVDLKIKVKIIDSDTIKGNFWQKISGSLRILKATLKSIYTIIHSRPKAVIGFGGYPAFPMLLAAKILKVPIFIHEQNCFLGKTNKFFLAYTKRLFLSFQDTLNIPQEYLAKTLLTGNLVRKEIREIDVNRNEDFSTFNIIVFGGSQGAKFLTTILPNVIKVIRLSKPDLKIKIIQQVHKSEVVKMKRAYKKMEIDCEISDFFHNISSFYRTSHLAIARSGASTIAEFISIGLPAIFIPLPHSANNHQTFNAKFLSENGASWFFNQNDVTPEVIAYKIMELTSRPKMLAKASEALLKMRTNATEMIANEVLKK